MKTLLRMIIASSVGLLLLAPIVSHATEAVDYQLPQPALTTMNIPIAWGLTKGDGSRIAVLDSGILPHTEYNQSYAFGDTYPSLSQEIVHPHGTYMAGVLSSQYRLQGVAPQAGLISFKVFHTHYTDDSLSWGVESAISAGVDVISMSLGSAGLDTSPYTKTVFSIQKAINKNIIVVNAAGNEGCDCPRWLAVLPSVVSVGSVNIDGSLSHFSNFGSWVDINAVGSNVITTMPDERYLAISGTSMAAPYVSGIAALMKSIDKSLTPHQFKQILKTTATNKIMNGGKAVYTWKGGLFSLFVPYAGSRAEYSIMR